MNSSVCTSTFPWRLNYTVPCLHCIDIACARGTAVERDVVVFGVRVRVEPRELGVLLAVHRQQRNTHEASLVFDH